MHVVRRGHLYLGLFLFPWAILYSVTGFLFNHPALFADAPITSFVRSDATGTPLEDLPTPQHQAEAVLAALNARQKPATPYKLGASEAHYSTRETFVATVKADARTFLVIIDPKTVSGTIRETTPRRVTEKAPFAAGRDNGPRPRGMGMAGPMKHDHAGVKIDDAVANRIKTALPTIMDRKGFPKGEVTVTTAPDVKFPVEAGGQLWTGVYNPITTTVSGTPGAEQSDLSVRGFLLRLHLSRGYPGGVNTRWVWATGVDAIAVVLCFWGVSGLFMWWQLKATRKLGLIVLVLSAIAATALGIGMHSILSA